MPSADIYKKKKMKTIASSSMSKSKLLVLVIVFNFIAALTYSQSHTYIPGNRQITDKLKTLDQFNSILIKGSWANVVIECGKMPMINITTDDNIQPYIKTELDNGKLTISATAWIEPTTVVIKIQIPFINSLETNGWVNVKLLNVNSPDLSLTGDVGKVLIAGAVQNLTINSKATIYQLNDLKIGKLSLAMAGAGRVYYKGKADIIGDKQVVKNIDDDKSFRNTGKAVSFYLSNNGSQEKRLFIAGPDDQFSYGLDIKPNTSSMENLPEGTKIYLFLDLDAQAKKIICTVDGKLKNQTIKL
jgi:hypothetical protein